MKSPLTQGKIVRFSVSGLALVAIGIAALGATTISTSSVALAESETGTEIQSGADASSLGRPVAFKRLSDEQYRRSIARIFGSEIVVPGRFEPPLRQEGLLAIGSAEVSISAAGFEQHALRANEIAAQVLAPERRAKVLGCAPASPKTFDRKCATGFVKRYGRLLYRRPLTQSELASVLDLAAAGTTQSGDFYKGVELGLARLLVSPNFLFRIERLASPDAAGTNMIDDFSLAARLSFLLWNAPPDDALLDAAANGSLRKTAGLELQVDRMMGDPLFKEGLSAFFSDMFAYDQFEGLTKDQDIYPKYTSQLARDAREQTLRTVIHHLVDKKGDYRDLFTTRETFMNRNLAALYKIPATGEILKGWAPYKFPEDSERAGLLSFAAFLMLDPTHEGRSSPTIRGKTVREQLLCQPVPPPPPNVNFAIVQDTSDPNFKTARQRLAKHSEEPVCASCHAITDPIGLSMENFDAVGAFRTHENGAPIDASGSFEGEDYTDLGGLSLLVRNSPSTTNCVVQRVFEYGTGRTSSGSDVALIEVQSQRFAESGQTFPDLLRTIAMSDGFRRANGAQLASKD